MTKINPVRVTKYASGSTRYSATLLKLDGGMAVLGIDSTRFDDYVTQQQRSGGWDVCQDFYATMADVIHDGWDIES